MKNFLPFLFLLITFPILSQNHFIGLKTGINWTDVNASNFPENRSFRTGFNSGLTYEYLINTHFNLGVDLLYFQKGFSSKMIFTDELGSPTGEEAVLRFKYDYFTLPIKWGYEIGNQFSAFANIGIIPSIIFHAETIEPRIEIHTENETHILESKTHNITDRVNRFDLGAMIEMGAKYRILPQLMVMTSFGYQQGITSITNEDYFKYSKVRHRGLILSFGVRYALKND